MVTEKDLEEAVGDAYGSLLNLLELLMVYYNRAIDDYGASMKMPPDYILKMYSFVSAAEKMSSAVFNMTELMDSDVLPTLAKLQRETALPVAQTRTHRLYK